MLIFQRSPGLQAAELTMHVFGPVYILMKNLSVLVVGTVFCCASGSSAVSTWHRMNEAPAALSGRAADEMR